MMPPWIWLSVVSALTTSPQSWTATTFLTRTMPVSTSTSTSANCAPAVKRFHASPWFSAREAVAETPSAGSIAQASFHDAFRSPPFAAKPPACSSTDSAGTPHFEARTEAIFFLADSQKSSFITGQALVVDGGALCRLSTE